MNEELGDKLSRDDVLRMTVDVVAAYISKNQVSAGQIPEVIHGVFDSMNALEGRSAELATALQKPATSVRKSVTPEYIVCLEDGKKLKMLKRHLRTTYDDGFSKLRQAAFRICQADWARSQSRRKEWIKAIASAG